MKSTLCAACVFAIALAGSVHGQMIVFSAPEAITGPSDIFTTGGYVDALQTFNTSTPIAVLNPLTNVSTLFNVYTSQGSVANPPAGTPGNFYADGTFSITADGNYGSDGSGSNATPYQAVLDGSTFVNYPAKTPGVIGTVTIGGLTSGDSYEVQVWAAAGYRNVTYTSANSQMLNYNPTGSTPSNGQYVLGLFTATGPTETFTYQNTYPIDVSAGEIDGIALHDLSVPEPSTYVLLGLGAIALFTVGRLRWAA